MQLIKSKFFTAVVFFLLLGCSFTLTNDNFYGSKLYLHSENNAGIYLSINNNGIVNGFSGCNDFNAKVSVNRDNQTIKVSSIASTNKHCSTELNNIENNFMKNLLAISSYDIVDNTMILKDNRNTKLATLVKN